MNASARLFVLAGLLGAVTVSPFLRAESGDVQGSRDYPGLPRIPGFVISDYTEDNPASFDFPVAHPTSLDADNVDTVRVRGHRYVIRYEYPGDSPPSLLQTQQFYEKLATRQGFEVVKSGAIHDVTETFHLDRKGHELWVYLDPAITINMLTIVEGKGEVVPQVPSAPPPPPPPPLSSPVPPDVIAPPETVLPAPAPPPPPLPESKPEPAQIGPAAAPPPMPASKTEPEPAVTDESLYSTLEHKGRVVLPVAFLPGQPDLEADSAPLILTVITMLQKHPGLRLEIDGFTDSTGDPRRNQRLSERRAEAVRALLVEGHIEQSRLDAVGLGGDQPVADNDTPEGRAKNRRIELALLKDTPPPLALAPVVATEKPVAEPPASKPTPPPASTTDETPSYHRTAPNGVNYYPQ